MKRIFDTPKDTARGFADHFLKLHKESDMLSIALSGGSTPKILFDLLADEYQDEFDWSRIQLYWGDERCVPPTDEQSNYKMTVDHLISKINIPESNVHRVLGENESEQEAIRYSEEITSNLPAANGLPQFDIMLLGLGGDGHTASIFPHEMELLQDERTCAIGTNPDSGQKRITLTGPIINNAKSICFLATGSGKAEKIDEIFNKRDRYLAYPAAHISPVDGELLWFLDQGANQ
ncbi:6-phosphogluconolactonase [Roseivirga sp. E12]|uniref:6-phosphogluconolactonase n=1 Tax=Roseivirga sp. E12 TaxID=2819237 RepID=UPI001ABC80C3|nr:6-phosphogluconolactonase [Roseivirga sp. E12]MBO3697406.1 6-phosphogluconolactonase [Roseivirga sp. E12]